MIWHLFLKPIWRWIEQRWGRADRPLPCYSHEWVPWGTDHARCRKCNAVGVKQ